MLTRRAAMLSAVAAATLSGRFVGTASGAPREAGPAKLRLPTLSGPHAVGRSHCVSSTPRVTTLGSRRSHTGNS